MAKKTLVELDMTGKKIINLATPTVATDAATKAYVDAAPASSGERVYIQNATPVSPPAKYLWVQTGLGAGADMTFWIQDGV